MYVKVSVEIWEKKGNSKSAKTTMVLRSKEMHELMSVVKSTTDISRREPRIMTFPDHSVDVAIATCANYLASRAMWKLSELAKSNMD